MEDATNRLAFAALMAQCKPELAADERAAREGLLDQAMASLRRAAAAGCRDAAKLKSDAIYSTIRGRPDYPSLLAAVETWSKATAPVAASAGPANLDRSKPAAGAVVQPTEIRLARARVLAAIGQIQAMAGRSEKGLEYLRQALSVQQRLVAEQPADAAWREELAGIQLSLGRRSRKSAGQTPRSQPWRRHGHCTRPWATYLKKRHASEPSGLRPVRPWAEPTRRRNARTTAPRRGIEPRQS